jgi:hypothetical protein
MRSAIFRPSANGTMWSSVPCTTKVGTSISPSLSEQSKPTDAARWRRQA